MRLPATTPLRVLHVIQAMRRGGAESVVVEHCRHAGAGVEVLVCALNHGGPALAAAAACGARTFVLGKGRRYLDGVRRLAALMRAERVDVANGHNPTGALYAALAGVRARVPVVFRTEHTLHYPGRHSALYPLLEPLATLVTRRVVCVCQAVLESHVSRLPWAARRFVTVANGISPAPHTRTRDEVRRALGLGPHDPVVLTGGGLTPQKAQHVLLEAFARVADDLPRARMLVAGDGPLEAALRSRAAALGLGERARFLGARDDVADLLEAADVFALSSLREGLSLAVLEAMRAGRPVVATRVGGNAEAVADGESGRIVPPGDAGALAAAIASLLADPARARAMGAAGRRRWAERFTAERMVGETEALYRAERARAAGGAASPARAEERHAPA